MIYLHSDFFKESEGLRNTRVDVLLLYLCVKESLCSKKGLDFKTLKQYRTKEDVMTSSLSSF